MSTPNSTPSSPFHVSKDGYLRLTWKELQDTVLIHLISGMDDPITEDAQGHIAAAAITGYTEWVSHGIPAITLGWDWQMSGERLRRINSPRTNIMLLNDSNAKELGQEKTLALLETYIDSFDWSKTAMDHLHLRYA